MTSELIKYFYECEDYFFRAISKESFNYSHQTRIYITAVPVASLNVVVIPHPIKDLGLFLNNINQFFMGKSLPWAAAFSLCDPIHALENGLESIHFAESENATSMCIPLNQIPPFHSNEALLIKATDTKLADWRTPLIEAFQSTVELTALYQKTHEHALVKKSQLHHLTLYLNEKPISSLTLSLQGKLARIDDFGTLPAHQRKGYGSYLLNFALDKLKKLGVEYCFLEAAESSLSLYEKLGFKILFKRKYLWDFYN
ncbi:GNAT family N-acetyltransferase [Legionella jamestowniensis]|uniref:GNAT family acetyltransferase n=1 Tax=Legionella jamestowniensis TaxID=455 RepID=A0A0W0UTY6_9GAMM|nr:GNAT family N-acetyltransferase [Legionella jamestowniensis]KTD11239.1 GNAT family acetyltransferase [Legionella jamestowniensis]SFL70145.1 Acetyltransferase (GNAT) domain-containing protein [Legionella jamestowniensis DSM 19215]